MGKRKHEHDDHEVTGVWVLNERAVARFHAAHPADHSDEIKGSTRSHRHHGRHGKAA